MKPLALLLLLVGCGERPEQSEVTEAMTLVFNSDAPQMGEFPNRDAPTYSAPDVEVEDSGSCLWVLHNETRGNLPMLRRRGASGKGCQVAVGSIADVTLLLVEGRDPAPINVQWR